MILSTAVLTIFIIALLSMPRRLCAVAADGGRTARVGPVRRGTLMLCESGDEDMKIVPDSALSKNPSAQDGDERTAQEYKTQKENGNVFIASRLGEELALPVLRGERELLKNVNDKNIAQLYFLYAFAVRGEIAEHIESSILADTTLRCFQQMVKEKNIQIYDAMSDSVPDTIYRLCGSSGDCLGEGFAKLCGREGDSAFITVGNESFESYRRFAAEKIKKVEFKK